MSTEATILQLAKMLYPKGRAFWMPEGGNFESFNIALAKSEARFFEDTKSTIDSIIPDNSNFTAEDATDWEERLGIPSLETLALADRKAAITRKMNHPGSTKGRLSLVFIESQLQAAGFNVYLHENIFPGGPKSPDEIAAGDFVSDLNHGQFNHGEINHGEGFNNLCVNYIEEEKDFGFVVADLRCTFFIGGEYLGSFADVDATRKDEFRQLILKLKPANLAAFLFINYI